MDDVAACGQSHEMILCHVLGRCNRGWDKGVSVAEHFQDKWPHATFAAGGIFIDMSWVLWGYLDYRAEQMIRSFDRNNKIRTLVNDIENVLRRFYFIIAVIGGHHLPVFPLVANIFVWQDHCIILVVDFFLQIDTPFLLQTGEFALRSGNLDIHLCDQTLNLRFDFKVVSILCKDDINCVSLSVIQISCHQLMHAVPE